METTITQVLRSRELTRSQGRSSVSCLDNHSFRSFLQKWNCDLQTRCGSNVTKSLFGNYPTLSQLNSIYGDNAAITWLMPQLYNLSEYCGVREKLQGKPLENCAAIIATDFHWLKVTEVMLFLHRFKSGKYGRFYGHVDPLIIMTALRTFLDERAEAYTRRDQDEREQKEAAQRGNAISWEQYCANHGIDRPSPFIASIGAE